MKTTLPSRKFWNGWLAAMPKSRLFFVTRRYGRSKHIGICDWWKEIEVAFALVRPENFDEEHDAVGNRVRTAQITYHKDRADRLWKAEDARKDYSGDFGFHYSPYNFDSLPEKDFLEKVLRALEVDPSDVEDVYFTGALGRDKTDFIVEYKGEDGRWHAYSPDFLIRRKPEPNGAPGTGKLMIVEIKSEDRRQHPIDGETGRKAIASPLPFLPTS